MKLPLFHVFRISLTSVRSSLPSWLGGGAAAAAPTKKEEEESEEKAEEAGGGGADEVPY